MQPDFVISSESVTAAHPDKLCDQVSDAIVDRHLRQDVKARVSAECAISTSILFVSVKAHSRATVDVPSLARDVLREVGYRAEDGFDPRSCTVMTSLHELPEEMYGRVNEEELDESEIEQFSARDQATVFGFSCNDTPEGMPLPIVVAHQLARRLASIQREDSELSPDGKTQVAIEYRNHRPARVHALTLSACQRRRESPTPARLAQELRERVIDPVFASQELRLDPSTRVAINPEGPLVPGGPVLHAGLTGRKTAVDGYGDFARHGAAALSGKDPSRIDRVGSYAARHVARNVVAAGLADRCEVQISYAIGLARPVSILVNAFGTNAVSETELAARIDRVFDLRPAAIVRRFSLRSLPARTESHFFRRLAAYGQVGRTDLELPWERLDHVEQLRAG